MGIAATTNCTPKSDKQPLHVSNNKHVLVLRYSTNFSCGIHSMLHRYVHGEWQDPMACGIGVDFLIKRLPGEPADQDRKLYLWKPSFSCRRAQFPKALVKRASAIVFVYNILNRTDFAHEDPRLRDVLKAARELHPDIPILLVGHEFRSCTSRAIPKEEPTLSFEEGVAKAKDIGADAFYPSVSAEHDKGITPMFDDLVRMMDGVPPLHSAIPFRGTAIGAGGGGGGGGEGSGEGSAGVCRDDNDGAGAGAGCALTPSAPPASTTTTRTKPRRHTPIYSPADIRRLTSIAFESCATVLMCGTENDLVAALERMEADGTAKYLTPESLTNVGLAIHQRRANLWTERVVEAFGKVLAVAVAAAKTKAD